ncbi:[citrate (pro-3S)-lyase] ligase [Deferribacter autotrophicus]|uniref:[Citrate [pro-3S]-lyase] ligase n=1 Tax=Deferribacter autotrophicus TaxID=500465 RepID=A0A5A8F015_9BACT|nr:[citrate (pro-3S)-lyase] ligase [Deferribacter autotrophicus]KAA0257132.1 [citrate (pro-3S)-lyase] ligase [Deferribacter autotrophicus]
MRIIDLLTENQIEKARKFLNGFGLSFEDTYDEIIGVYVGEKLIGTGAYHKNVLKMVAVDKDYQNQDVLGLILTELIDRCYRAGYEHLFLFTLPSNIESFTALNFKLLITTSKAALLEYGNDINTFLNRYKDYVHEGENGGVVVNCNPFTKGHRYLIERASKEVDWLYVFVVREDRSTFSFEDRYKLVKKGVEDLKNVVVLNTGPYAVSSVTFPSYFLHDKKDTMISQIEVDLKIFCKYFAPFFYIRKRFVGTEPYCNITNTYNEMMKKILPSYGIELVEIERLKNGEGFVSASKVRKFLAENRIEEIKNLVPDVTYNYLLDLKEKEKLCSINIKGRH